jgi:hypothetical protein
MNQLRERCSQFVSNSAMMAPLLNSLNEFVVANDANAIEAEDITVLIDLLNNQGLLELIILNSPKLSMCI